MAYTNPLSTIDLTEPVMVQMKEDVAMQLHQQRPGYLASPQVLTDAISDIIFDLSIQGASFLEVHVIDPSWQLLMPNKSGASFIDIDQDGFLLPIYFEFPKGSGKSWYLVAANPVSDTSQGNIKLTFEDRTVYALRNLDAEDGPALSSPTDTRLTFIRRLLKVGNIVSKELFSQATIAFETPPKTFTPEQVATWDKNWTAQQLARQRAAAAKKLAAQQAAAHQAFINAEIGSLSQPDPVKIAQTGTTQQNQWWAINAPGAENSAGADYVPNAGYVPGLGVG